MPSRIASRYAPDFSDRDAPQMTAADPARSFRVAVDNISVLDRKRAARGGRGKRYGAIEEVAAATVAYVDRLEPRPKRMQLSSATAIVGRSAVPAADGGVSVGHDTRVNAGALWHLYTEAQLVDFGRRLPPSLVVLADRGFPGIVDNALALRDLVVRAARPSQPSQPPRIVVRRLEDAGQRPPLCVREDKRECQ